MRDAWCLALLLVGFCSHAMGAVTNRDQCLLDQLNREANNNLTVLELKALCRDASAESTAFSALGESVSDTSAEVGGSVLTMPRGFRDFFTPYKENYFLFGSMQNKDGGEPFSGKTLDIRFEFGMKFRMFQNREEYSRLSPLHFGYSQRSWWDIAESSAPFAEHNYNPEIFWDFKDVLAEDGLVPYKLHELVDQFGYEHQSNGRDGLLSRSWDRIYAQRTFDFPEQNLRLRLKAWNVVATGEENRDITDYLGNGEVKLTYLAPSTRWQVSTSVMKGHESSKYSYRLDYISNMTAWLNSRFMLSYYDGYGEALVSYNEKTKSLRAGIYIPVAFD